MEELDKRLKQYGEKFGRDFETEYFEFLRGKEPWIYHEENIEDCMIRVILECVKSDISMNMEYYDEFEFEQTINEYKRIFPENHHGLIALGRGGAGSKPKIEILKEAIEKNTPLIYNEWITY